VPPEVPVVEVPVPPEVPVVEVPVPPEVPEVEVPVPPEVPVVEVPVPPEVPVVEVPEEPVVVVLLPDDPLVEVPPLEPLWAGVKGMVPPPQPTRETTANTKIHILSMRHPSKSGIGTCGSLFGQMGLRGPRASNFGLLN
jgi:hypothetical protein